MIIIDGRNFERIPIRTHWLDESDDLEVVLLEYCADRRPGDTVVVGEKASLLLTGRSVLIETLHIHWEARMLSRFVRRRPGNAGLSIPAKMQYVFDQVGRPRVYAAAIAAALTRPFGHWGTFYRFAGEPARDVDGGSAPYQDRLFPPFDADTATALCNELEAKLDTGVAIVDINDFGGSIRAVSNKALPAETLLRVLADNPLGQGSASTPFALVRPC